MAFEFSEFLLGKQLVGSHYFGLREGEGALFVVRPQAKDFDDAFALKHLVHQPMLNVDASRVGSS